MLKIVHVPGLQYSGETAEQARERDRQIEEWNAAVDAENEKWKPYPMKALWPWCRQHAPHLLPPAEQARMAQEQE